MKDVELWTVVPRREESLETSCRVGGGFVGGFVFEERSNVGVIVEGVHFDGTCRRASSRGSRLGFQSLSWD